VNAQLRPLVGLLLFLAATPVFAQGFYEARFQSGVIDFNRAAYARAVDELRIAAFGRVDDIPAYETAEIYLTIANDKLDRVEDARIAALKVTQAERISPVYTTLKIPPDVRSAFEPLLPALLNREQLGNVPAFARFASQAPSAPLGALTPSLQPRTFVLTPTKEPNVAVTVKKNDDKVATPQPALDYGRMALERVAAGDEAGARRYADLAFAADDTNPDAHTALAQIGRAHNAWNDVAEHYAVVRTRRRLTEDEAAAYLIALVDIGRVSDAAGVRNSLPASVLGRPDVRQALQSIEPKQVPTQRPPTPVPHAPSPVPQPPAPVAHTPSPVAQPLLAPVPVPVAPSAAPDSATQPVTDQIDAAERMVGVGNIVGARTELRRIATIPTLQRSERQALARALSQTALYAESSAQYRKTYPLKAGEESHMFYEAVNRYELGDYALARQLITRAMPALPQTSAILAYRDRILAQQ
jgi:tetratricopeptide (TPR) repeat protein